jgi:hypothetical protein
MRATASLALIPHLVALVTTISIVACLPKEHPDPDWLKPPDSYDPVGTEGLTLNKLGVDALTLVEKGDERDAHVQALMAPGKFAGQAQCKSGAGTGTQAHSKYGEFELTCTAGTILFDIEVAYNLFTSREHGKPLSANAFVEFGGTLVEFDYHDDTKPRQIVAKVEVGEDLRRLER